MVIHILLSPVSYQLLREAHHRQLWQIPRCAAPRLARVAYPAERPLANVEHAFRSLKTGRKSLTRRWLSGAQLATLLADLATIVRSTCRAPNAGPDAPTFKIVTTLNAQQQRALDLIWDIHV